MDMGERSKRPFQYEAEGKLVGSSVGFVMSIVAMIIVMVNTSGLLGQALTGVMALVAGGCLTSLWHDVAEARMWRKRYDQRDAERQADVETVTRIWGEP